MAVQITVRCDGDAPQGGPACDRGACDDAAQTEGEARRSARQKGWVRRTWNGTRYDWCPFHAGKYRP